MSTYRIVRRTAAVLALAAPLALAVAPVASAAGGDAVVSASVAEGSVHVTSTKGLSRVTVVLCGGDTVVADRWIGEQKSGDVPVAGIVQAVFIHSGDNTTAEAQALLAELAGADEVKGNSTGAVAFYDEDACDEPEEETTTTTSSTTTTSTTTGESSTTTTTGPEESATTTSTSAPTSSTTATTAGPQTSVLGETLEKAGPPAAGPGTAVSPETLTNPGTLPRTGAGRTMFLLTVASALIGAGVALLSTFRRRRAGSASSPC